MALLITGVLLWSAVHLFPGVASDVKPKLVGKLGKGYRALFALLIVVSLVCIVFGWRSAVPTMVYTLPDGMRIVTAVLMLVSLVLFFSSRVPTDIKRVLRHPQLTGVFLWAVAHLLSSGDSRSLVLFGGIGAWALIEILAINRRDGAWLKPETVGFKRSLIPLVIGIAAWLVLILVHPWIAGVPALRGA
jgi:uncharacterized membrane protein